MANKIEDFISMVKTGGMARNNRYKVFFFLPKVLRNIGVLNSEITRMTSLYCDATALPGVSYSTAQAKTYGEVREMPYERMFDNINLSFYIDSDMKIKYMFDAWVQNIQDINTRSFNYYKDYTVDMYIDVQNYNEENKYRVMLYECYPKSVSPINMEYAGKDVMKLQVSLNYKYWKSDLIGVTDDIGKNLITDNVLPNE